MRRLGILGGMGPAATVDFMAKLLALTPACRDQDHLPTVVASLPQTPDRSAAILAGGPDPLPSLLEGIRLLDRADVELIVIPCATSHHWYAPLSAASRAPILHIARCVAARIAPGEPTLILATRGALVSGFYQRALAERAIPFVLPSPTEEQVAVDDCIRLIKAGRREEAGACLNSVFQRCRNRGVRTLILGCTELPLAAQHTGRHDLRLIDCALELAREAVARAVQSD